jgi:dTDP-L-rhamnose 4-epimerase
MSKKILITGGAGFIGSNLALRLSDKGHHVVVLDNLAPQIHGENPDNSPTYKKILGRVEFIKGDVTSADDLKKALTDIDTIVHLAAETGTGQSMYAINHYAHVNVGGTALLLDLIANGHYPVRRLVVASSRAVYGEGKYQCPVHGVSYPGSRSQDAMSQGRFEHYCPLCSKPLDLLKTDEMSALNPTSIYGVTKLTQEQLMLSVGKALGISAIAFRYQNVYGPGQSLSNPYTGILSIFSTRMRADRPINIFEDGLESRDFVFIDDVVDATLRGIENSDVLVDMFNVGSGVSTSVIELAKNLRHCLNSNSEITISGEYRVGDIRHNLADLAKVQQVLGFAPTISIEAGLQHFVNWVITQESKVDRYEDSLQEMRKKGLFK